MCIDSESRVRKLAVIRNVLDNSDDHPDVDTIYQRCKAKDKFTSIASVYQTLRIFGGSGLIEKRDVGDGKARFEIKRTDHEHLMDVETGQIHEFKSQELQRLIEEIADEMGFDLTEHRLEIYGRKQGRTACRCYEIKIISTKTSCRLRLTIVLVTNEI